MHQQLCRESTIFPPLEKSLAGRALITMGFEKQNTDAVRRLKSTFFLRFSRVTPRVQLLAMQKPGLRTKMENLRERLALGLHPGECTSMKVPLFVVPWIEVLPSVWL
mmetsp:Transcript_11291/g.24296  ORF Transcript_11291/g.24296 Transcript_11291/m.24296 type:complete len:107 (+) Transcript_11291:211-531(+)